MQHLRRWEKSKQRQPPAHRWFPGFLCYPLGLGAGASQGAKANSTTQIRKLSFKGQLAPKIFLLSNATFRAHST